MKKTLALLLAAASLLCLAACKESETQVQTLPENVVLTEAPTTEAPTTVPTTAPTTVPATAPTEAPKPAKEYPQTIADSILLEGEPQRLDMELFDGGNYVVYIIKDMWTLETSTVDGYLNDRWVCSFNDMIDFRVISFGPTPMEEAEQYIRDHWNTYTPHLDNPDGLSGADKNRHYFLNVDMKTDGVNTFAVMAEFPMEAADGFAPRTTKMMDSFEIK